MDTEYHFSVHKCSARASILKRKKPSDIFIFFFYKLMFHYFTLLPYRYDVRQTSAKIPNPPKSWSSPAAFGGRAYFHTSNNRLQHDQDLVDHLTVDRAMATDTGVYRCRIDFLKAPTRNRLVNLTVIGNKRAIYFQEGSGATTGLIHFFYKIAFSLRNNDENIPYRWMQQAHKCKYYIRI